MQESASGSDILNFIYGYELVNSNKEKQNTPYIDLVDNKRRLFFQVTTTRTKEKIENTLQILNEYKDYEVKILYLLEKSKPNKETITELNSKYNMNLLDSLYDSSDLIRDINDLETTKLKDFYNKYFKNLENKYSEISILDLVIKHLVHNKKKCKRNYLNDDFGTIESNEKLQLNKINQKISSEINSGIDYRILIEKLEEDNTITNLKALIVDDKYKSILETKLLAKVKREEILNKDVSELHILSKLHNLNYNEVISELYENINSEVEIDDFNSLNVTWIIISFFFEICDIGIKE